MKEITQEILDELNNEYSDAIFEFVFQPDMDGVVDIKLKKQYSRYIDSYIINLEDDVHAHIRSWFEGLGLKIKYNNTRSCFWALATRD